MDSATFLEKINLLAAVMRTFAERVENSYRLREPALIEQMLARLRSRPDVSPTLSQEQVARGLEKPAVQEKDA